MKNTKEYNNRHEKPLVNPAVTLEEYERSKKSEQILENKEIFDFMQEMPDHSKNIVNNEIGSAALNFMAISGVFFFVLYIEAMVGIALMAKWY